MRKLTDRLGALFSYLVRLLLGVPLRFKIMGMVMAVITIFAAVSLLLVYDTLTGNMEDLLEKEGRTIALELAHQTPDYLLIQDLYGLTRLLSNTVNSRPDLRYAVVSDRYGKIVAHTFGHGFPRDLLRHYQRGEARATEINLRRLPTNEGLIWEAEAPIMMGEEGLIRVGVREDSFRDQIKSFLTSFTWSYLWVIMIGLLLSTMLTWLITRPVINLLQSTRAVRQGDYTVILPTGTEDEFGQLFATFNDMVGQLAEADQARREKEKIRREFLQRVIAGQEGERKRIARELHDQTGQALASLMVGLKMLENSADSPAIRERVGLLKQTITTEMEAIHRLAVTLRPSVLDDMGLIPALEMLIADARKHHCLDIRLTLIGFANRRADGCVETCVYRIVQEAVINIIRHAEATEAKVLLEWRRDSIRGIVEDDGCGFTPETPTGTDRLGLYGMRERAELLGGSLRIDSEPSQGTMVVFNIPTS